MIQQAEAVKCLLRQYQSFGRWMAVHFFQRQRDIMACGEMGKQVELLEQKSIFTAVSLERGNFGGKPLAIDFDDPLVCCFQPAEQSQQRAFPPA